MRRYAIAYDSPNENTLFVLLATISTTSPPCFVYTVARIRRLLSLLEIFLGILSFL